MRLEMTDHWMAKDVKMTAQGYSQGTLAVEELSLPQMSELKLEEMASGQQASIEMTVTWIILMDETALEM